MGENAIKILNLTKEYKLYDRQIDRLKESFHPFRKKYHRKFYALNDISFEVRRGEKLGIIGANGAGKSTLLKILTGVLNPSSGSLMVNGKVAALLELGAGFNMDYTGMENIYLNGTLMGYSDQQIEERVKRIVEFADIGDFIYQPVKSYSSGMFVRLAFSTQIFSEPDILIVDEALSVGDIRFQQKCFRAMESLMKEKTVVLVTHDTAAVTRFCQRVIWMNQGTIMYDGEVTEGLKKYQGYLVEQAIEEKEKIGGNDYLEESHTNVKDQTGGSIFIPEVLKTVVPKGTGDAVITHCGLLDEKNLVIKKVKREQRITCAVRVQFHKKIVHPILGLAVRDRLGNEVIGINSETIDCHLPAAKGEVEYFFHLKVPELNQGTYTITVAIANGYQMDHVQLCWLDDVLIMEIPKMKYDIPGFLYLEKGAIEIRQN